MISSLFFIGKTGDILFEKYYNQPCLDKIYCDPFCDMLLKGNMYNIPPVINSSDGILINTLITDLYIVSIVKEEDQSLLMAYFLERLGEFLKANVENFCASNINANSTTIYKLIDSICQGGFPCDSFNDSILHVSKKNGNLLNTAIDIIKLTNNKVIIPKSLSVGNVTWRNPGIIYDRNEIFFDVEEKINCIMDNNGNFLHKTVFGRLKVKCNLSGMPEIVVNLANPNILHHVTLHQCVKKNRWLTDKVLSFIPPDNSFTLIEYVPFNNFIHLPLKIIPVLSLARNPKMDIIIEISESDKTKISDLYLRIKLPESVVNFSMENHPLMTWSIIEKTNYVEIEVPCILKKEYSSKVTFKSTFNITGDSVNGNSFIISVSFNSKHFCASSLKVKKMDMYTEKYEIFKGILYKTDCDQMEIRS